MAERQVHYLNSLTPRPPTSLPRRRLVLTATPMTPTTPRMLLEYEADNRANETMEPVSKGRKRCAPRDSAMNQAPRAKSTRLSSKRPSRIPRLKSLKAARQDADTAAVDPPTEETGAQNGQYLLVNVNTTSGKKIQYVAVINIPGERPYVHFLQPTAKKCQWMNSAKEEDAAYMDPTDIIKVLKDPTLDVRGTRLYLIFNELR